MKRELISDEALRQEAKRIADDVRSERIELPSGETGWVGHDADDGMFALTTRNGLYSGQLGVATYFASMYDTFGQESYRQTVSEAVDFLLEADVDELLADVTLGAGNGLGSVVYGLSVLWNLTGERRYYERAREFAGALTDERIRATDEYDLMWGTAGGVLGLLKLYEDAGDDVALDRAVTCGEHLLANRHDKWGYRVWDTFRSDAVKSFSTGLGHGATGVCYALYRLYGHTRRDEFRDATDEALSFENVFYSERNDNWKANWLSVPHYPVWWEYGVVGIGLGRLGSLEYCDSHELRRDLHRAREFRPELASRDAIRDGTFSQVDFLVELGRKFGDEYHRQARKLATEAIERRRRTGTYRLPYWDVDGLYNPTLFSGTAGVGYTILRLLRPDDVPSILRFE